MKSETPTTNKQFTYETLCARFRAAGLMGSKIDTAVAFYNKGAPFSVAFDLATRRRPPADYTPQDLQRLLAAKEKRERKAALRAARAL